MTILERVYATKGQPAWEIAHLFPAQGEWSVADYLALDTNHLVEFSDGYIEVLPLPSPAHQRIVLFLYRILWAFVTEHQLGEALTAPLPVELWSKKFREPDIIFIAKEKLAHQSTKYWRNVDLVIEVVSPDKPARDYQDKRAEYAQAGIPEYWIVDPQQRVVVVLVLHEGDYQTHGEFKTGTQATSVLLNGFALPVAEVFAAGQSPY